MSNVLQNPFFIMYLITALVSLVHEVIEPRFPAVAKFTAAIKATGLDVPTVYRALRSVFIKLPALPMALLCLTLGGCASNTVVSSAADVISAESGLQTEAAPLLEDKCLTPMKGLATAEQSQATTNAVAVLAAKCDPAEIAYDQARAMNLNARGLLVQIAGGGAVTVATLLQAIRDLTAQAATLTKALAAIQGK